MHERAIGSEIGPQDSTPIIPNTTREYKMFVRYPQHDLGVQDFSTQIQNTLSTALLQLYGTVSTQHSYQHIRAHSEHTHQPLTHHHYLDKFESTIHT
jgi:hypothetical protein